MKKTLPLLLFTFFLSANLSAQTLLDSMSYGGSMRDFLVHLPPGFNNNQHLPLVLNLHGSTSNGGEQEFYSQMSYVADTSGFVVVYPDGIGNEWNVGFNSPYSSGIDDVGFLSKVIDTLAQLYNIDLSRVYSCGMSDGGFMSHRLACELGNRLAAIATVAGVPTDSAAFYCTQARHIPVMHVHGTADPLVPYAGYHGGDTSFLSAEQAVAFWVNKDLCSSVNDTTFIPDTNIHDSSTVQKIHYGGCSGNTQVLFYKIVGGGHTWPNAPFEYIYGPTNHDIDGSTEIWKFFKQYTNVAASVSEPAQSSVELNVYPNPFTTDVKLESSDVIEHIELQNVLGERILVQQVSATNVAIHFPVLESGVYLLKVEGSNFSQVKRVVKE